MFRCHVISLTRRAVVYLALLLALSIPFTVHAHRDGINGASGASYTTPSWPFTTTCSGCHISAAMGPAVTITGPIDLVSATPLAAVESGQRVGFAVTVTGSAAAVGLNAVGGLDVSINSAARGTPGSALGNLFATDPALTQVGSISGKLTKLLKELTHTRPLPTSYDPAADSLSFSVAFEWRAPSVAVDTDAHAHVAALLGNGDTTDGGDGSRYATRVVRIKEAPPAEARLGQASYTAVAGEPVQFDASASLGFGLTYSWDFGDSTPIVVTTDPSPSHTYLNHGSYTLTLTVSDARPGKNSPNTVAQAAVVVQARPVADPGGPYGGTVGQAITLDGSYSTDLDAPAGVPVLDYIWGFGAGAQNCSDIQTAFPRCTYSTQGTKTVSLTVRDQQGLAHTGTTTAQISPLGAPEVTTAPMQAGDSTQFSALFRGVVTTKDAGAEVYFQYTDDAVAARTGDFSAYPPTKSTTLLNPRTTYTDISAEALNLTCGSTYYYRAVAQNRGGNATITFGSTRRFNTASCTPVVPQPTALDIVTLAGTTKTTQIRGLRTGGRYGYQLTSGPSVGSAQVSATGLVSYTAPAGYVGPDQITVTVTDQGSGLEGDVIIDIEVGPGFAAPAAPVASTQSGAGSGAIGPPELVIAGVLLYLLVLCRRRGVLIR